MPSPSIWLLVVVISLAIGFGIVNGFNDAANAIATVIGTRVLSPRNAIIMAAILNFAGSATGVQVAKTIGKGIIVPEAISFPIIIAGLLSIIIWGALATYRGLPISLTHGLVAGLVGAGLALSGADSVIWSTLWPILAWVILAPLLGFLAGFAAMVAIYWLFRRAAPERVRGLFSGLQILSAAFVSYSHGLNDGQNALGVILMAFVLYTGNASLWEHVPLWAVAIPAAAISFGTATGGWNVIKTLGMKMTSLRPVHGFAAETSAALVIELASLFGIPISTTHCISASIMGVGATKRFSAVRWGVAGNILAAWVITFPLCGGLSYLFAWLLRVLF